MGVIGGQRLVVVVVLPRSLYMIDQIVSLRAVELVLLAGCTEGTIWIVIVAKCSCCALEYSGIFNLQVHVQQ